MKTIQEMLQELSQCIVTVSGEFRFRTNWNGGKVPQPEKPDLDTFDPNVPFCIENVGDVKANVQYNTKNTNIRISKDYKTWNDYTTGTDIELNPKDRVYIKSDYVLDESATPKFNFTNANGTRLRARGNIASLLYGAGDEYITKYTIAAQYCYKSMFDNCTSLIQAPELPAITLASNCYNSMFSGCASLTKAPDLPATALADYCYRFMFNGCANLTQAPDLPATTLADYCYDSMFQHCTSLTQAPDLPAKILTQSCYIMMFRGCTGLTQAPELPATTLAKNCYDSMFQGCTSLTQAPGLPTTILVDYCYDSMFSGCTSLTQAPELPATTLAYGCYSYMFEGCAGLTRASELPATTLADYCYYSMFSGCTKLNYVKCLATDTSATNCTKDWLSNVSATGTFECDNKKYFTIDNPNGIPVGWSITEINPDVEKPDLDVFDPNVPFCIENVGDVQASVQYNTKNTNIRISKDYKTWNDYTSGDLITLDPTDRVYIKSDYVKDTGSNPRFVFNGDGARLRARGNIASLIYGTGDEYITKYTIAAQYCYKSMFRNCKSLVQAPELPATTLDYSCYNSMFSGCASLTQAPELPATKLASYCYSHMFYGCTSLTQAPELPATTLADNCYYAMFQGCMSLTQAPELPATRLYSYCYYSMFYGCASLTRAPELPATTLTQECYNGMFLNCTLLTKAPELPAKRLYTRCYAYMFYGCTSLVQAPVLPATGLFYCCYDSMFYGCTSLTQAPVLPATTLAESCYHSMFQGCRKLNYIKCLATATSARECTTNWLYNVSATGTFECDNKKYFTIDSTNGIPVGWTITEINPDVEKPDLDTFDPNVPFCIENVGETPVEIGMYDVTSNIRNSCEISYNNKDWIIYNLAVDPNPSDIKKITLSNKGDRVYIKSNHSGTTMSPTPYTRIKVLNESDTTKIQARGNIASLNYARNDEYKTKYNTTENSCYIGLFMSCKSLIKAPDLVATSLSKSCYMSMFSGCANLKYIKCDATDISASNSTFEWVRGVSSTGDFYTPASTSWSSGISGIPSGWTRHDIT